MPITSIITIPPLPESFPSDCRFIGGRDGDMKALGQTLGISVYKEIYLTTLSGASSVTAEGNGWNIKVINRFIGQGIVHRHKAKLYLRALPASPHILNEEIPHRVRVGLVVACWGIRSRIRTAELAWIKHTALHGSSPLWTFALDVSCDVANRGQAHARLEQLLAKTGAEHITPKKIAEAVARKGAAYWVTWYRHWDQFCAASEVKDGAAYLYRLVTNSNDTLPYSIPEDLVLESEDLATPNPEDLATSMPEDLAENPEDLVLESEDLVLESEDLAEIPEDLVLDPPIQYKGTNRTIRTTGTHRASRAPAHPREAEADHDGDAMLHAFYQSLKTWLVETVKVDDVGVRAKIRDCKNPETVQQKCRWFERWLNATIEELPGNIFRFKDTGQTVANIEGFILKALFATWESPGIDDQIDIFMTQHFDLYEGHPPLPWEQWIPISHDTELQQISRPADPDPDPDPPAALPVIVDTPSAPTPDAPEVGTEAEALMRLKEIGMGTLPDDFVAAQMSDKFAMQYRRQGIHWTAARVKHYRERDVQNHTSETGTVQELPI